VSLSHVATGFFFGYVCSSLRRFGARLGDVASVAGVRRGFYTLWTRGGRGVRTLGGFAVLWGLGNGFTNAMDLYLSAALGIVTQTQFVTTSFPQRLELVLAVGTLFSVLLITVAPFAWTAFALNYTTRLQPRHRRLYAGAVGIVTVFVVIFTGPSILNVIGIDVGPADGFLFLTGLVVVGSQIGVAGAGVAQLYRSAQRHRVFDSVEALTVSAPLLLLFNNAANNFGLYGTFLWLYSAYFILHLVGLVGLVVAIEWYDLFDQLPAASAIGRDTAMDTVELGIMVTDRQGRITDLNETAKSMFDVGDGAIGTSYRELHASMADVDLTDEGRRTLGIPESGSRC